MALSGGETACVSATANDSTIVYAKSIALAPACTGDLFWQPSFLKVFNPHYGLTVIYIYIKL